MHEQILKLVWMKAIKLLPTKPEDLNSILRTHKLPSDFCTCANTEGGGGGERERGHELEQISN